MIGRPILDLFDMNTAKALTEKMSCHYMQWCNGKLNVATLNIQLNFCAVLTKEKSIVFDSLKSFKDWKRLIEISYWRHNTKLAD